MMLAGWVFYFFLLVRVCCCCSPHTVGEGASLRAGGTRILDWPLKTQRSGFWGPISRAKLRAGGGAAALTACCVQAPFFLFVVFVVYTLLPFSTLGAVVAGLVSSTSHLLVLANLMKAFTNPSVHVGLQVRDAGLWVWGRLSLGWGCGSA